jgi:hypothetical protein
MPLRRPTAPILAATLLLAACAGPAAAPGGFANRAAVPHPEALFDPAPRAAALRRNDGRTGAPVGERICPRARDVVDWQPLLEPSLTAMAAGPTGTLAPRDFARALNGSAYRVLVAGDQARAAADIAALRAHAERNAWLPPQGESWSAAAAVVDGMLPLLPAWQILRQTDAATDADRATIDAWLARLAAFTDIHPGENATGAARGANDMLLGLMLGDDARYRKGVRDGFTRQLAAMRADGSFPREVERGRGALELTNRNIALLVYAARIAASQGEDLYALRVNGRGLDEAIDFLLAADADNALVDAYARANVNPPRTVPDFRPDDQLTPWNSAARGWVRLYADRFPGSDRTAALLARAEPGARINSDAVGGYVTCYASRI